MKLNDLFISVTGLPEIVVCKSIAVTVTAYGKSL